MNRLPLKLTLQDILDKPPLFFLQSNQNLKVFTNTYGGGHLRLTNSTITSHKHTSDDGIFFYIKDVSKNKFWSSTLWPTNVVPDFYQVEFNGKTVRFERKDGDIETITEIAVAPYENVEIRKITLINHSAEERTVELTSYLDPVLLDDNRKDRDHPSFYNLFVQSRFDKDLNGIFFNRRSFSSKVNPPELFHKVVFRPEHVELLGYETSRRNILGRLNNLDKPEVLEKDLTNFTGDVLDPACSFKMKVTLQPSQVEDIFFLEICDTFVDNIKTHAKNYGTFEAVNGVFNIAADADSLIIREMGLMPDKILLFQKICSFMITGNTHTTNIKRSLEKNKGHVDSLWKNSISGDFPVLLVVIDNEYFHELVIDIVECHEYLTRSGYNIDAVFLNETGNPNLVSLIENEINQMGHGNKIRKNKGFFVLESSQVDTQDSLYLKHFAQFIVNGSDFNVTLSND
jgi:cyclic beta-1,2-glucan synthetase